LQIGQSIGSIAVMTDQALIPSPRDVKPSDISRKVRDAIDAMIWRGIKFDEAAREVGMSVRNMRLALERPAVLSYLRRQKQVMRESASGANVLALTEVRDQRDNQMARVQAVKALEQLADVEQARGGAQQAMPGLVIRIVTETPIKTTLNANGDLIDE
jgi:hypothetical protein